MERRRKVYTNEDDMEGTIAIIKLAKLKIQNIGYKTFLTEKDEAVYAITVNATGEQFVELQAAIRYNNGL